MIDNLQLNIEKARKIIAGYETTEALFRDWLQHKKSLRSTILEEREQLSEDSGTLDRLLSSIIGTDLILKPGLSKRELEAIDRVIDCQGWVPYKDTYDKIDIGEIPIKSEIWNNTGELHVYAKISLSELLKISQLARLSLNSKDDVELIHLIYGAFTIGYNIGKDLFSDATLNVLNSYAKGFKDCILKLELRDKSYLPTLKKAMRIFDNMTQNAKPLMDNYMLTKEEIEQLQIEGFDKALSQESMSYIFCIPSYYNIHSTAGQKKEDQVKNIFNFLYDTVRFAFYMSVKEQFERIAVGQKEIGDRFDIESYVFFNY